MDVAHYAASDKDVLYSAQVRVLEVVLHRDLLELDVQVLVDGLEGAGDFDVIFELDRDLLVDEGFEEAE